MSAHTPGPWIARRGTIGTAQFHIAEMMPSAYPDMPPGFAPAAQQEANAALIVAAPELLDAARAAVRYDEAIQSCANDPEKMSSFCSAEDETLDDLYTDWIDKARAAIAKAEGA